MDKKIVTRADIEQVREIEGFPRGSNEAFMNISQAPSYTSFPNPFLGEFVSEHGTPYSGEIDDYHREPYAADVAEDKHDLIYNIHSYHTKVPPKAIKCFIEHYTNPGDIVLDSFCGTGMTGVAAKICDDHGVGKSQRHAILVDLSTIATFIAGNYNQSIQNDDILEIEEKLKRLKSVVGSLYVTNHVQDGKKVVGFEGIPITGDINYTVWSDVFVCPHCSTEPRILRCCG